MLGEKLSFQPNQRRFCLPPGTPPHFGESLWRFLSKRLFAAYLWVG